MDKPLVFELSTEGGDADVGRRIAEELRLWQMEGREVFFLGKTYVFSAGITIMAAVPPDHRFLTADTELLIHERKMKKSIKLDGALRGCRTSVQDVLAEIDSGQRLQQADFAAFAKGSRITVDEIEKRLGTSRRKRLGRWAWSRALCERRSEFLKIAPFVL